MWLNFTSAWSIRSTPQSPSAVCNTLTLRNSHLDHYRATLFPISPPMYSSIKPIFSLCLSCAHASGWVTLQILSKKWTHRAAKRYLFFVNKRHVSVCAGSTLMCRYFSALQQNNFTYVSKDLLYTAAKLRSMSVLFLIFFVT